MLIVSHSLEEHNDMFDRVLTIRNHFCKKKQDDKEECPASTYTYSYGFIAIYNGIYR